MAVVVIPRSTTTTIPVEKVCVGAHSFILPPDETHKSMPTISLSLYVTLHRLTPDDVAI